MGTSASSRGPASNVPFVPPWVAPLPGADGNAARTNNAPPDAATVAAVPAPPRTEIAPERRFAGARSRLGAYARGGNTDSLRSGLGHYVRTGLGGSARGSARMAGTARTAGALYRVLDAFRSGQVPRDLPLDPATLVGRSARAVLDAIADAIRPTDGTQDTEASRQAMDRALSEVLEEFPNADLLAPQPAEIDLMVESFVAHDLCIRIELDVGRSIQSRAGDPATAVRRLEEMREYVMASVRAAFAARRDRGERLSRTRALSVVANVLQDTLSVFEEYLE